MSDPARPGGAGGPASAIDVARARRETPGCRSVAHLNNAGAALPPQVVLDTVVAHLRAEATIGGYEAAAAAKDRTNAIYTGIARLIGCRPEEIALAESATRAWDLGFASLPLEAGQVVLTGEAEYSSNVLAFLQASRRRGITLEVIGNDATGQIDVGRLDRRVRELGAAAGLVALTHVPTSGGLVNPAAEVGAVARAAGVPYLLDACQSVGQLDVDVSAIGCDLLSATGRKFLRAPRGTGFLYVSSRILDRLEPPFIDLLAADWVAEDDYALRPDARRFEAWESSVATRLGLGAAVDYALGWGLPAIEARVVGLAARLRTALESVPGVTVHDLGARRSGIVTFSVAGQEAPSVVERLRSVGVNTSVTWAATARYDLGRRELGDLVRASVHYYNDDDDLDALLAALGALGGSARVFRAPLGRSPPWTRSGIPTTRRRNRSRPPAARRPNRRGPTTSRSRPAATRLRRPPCSASTTNRRRRWTAAERADPPVRFLPSAAGSSPGAITLRLPYRRPLHPDNLFGHLAATAVPGVEEWADGSYRRTLRLEHGAGVVTLTPPSEGSDGSAAGTIRCTLSLTDLRDLTAAIARCRRLLDLDADPLAIDDALTADPALAPLIARAPGRRVPGSVDPEEMAVRAVLGQQVSTAAARTHAARLVAAHGDPVIDPSGRLSRLFPTPAALCSLDPATLALPESRKRTLLALVTALADGTVDLGIGCDWPTTRARLLALPGIGPWTVETLAMRGLGDPDAFLAGDLGIRTAARRLGLPDGPALERHARRWSPWRSYATQHLWATGEHAVNRLPAA